MICFKGVKGEFLVATKFFQVSCHFSMIFINFFKIPWYFQVFQVYPHFSRFSRSSGNPAVVRPPLGVCVCCCTGWSNVSWVMVTWDPTVNRQKWKHYLPANTVGGSKSLKCYVRWSRQCNSLSKLCNSKSGGLYVIEQIFYGVGHQLLRLGSDAVSTGPMFENKNAFQ